MKTVHDADDVYERRKWFTKVQNKHTVLTK